MVTYREQSDIKRQVLGIVIGIVIAGIGAALIYVYVRNSELPTSLDLSHPQTYQNIQPASCTFSYTDFTSAVRGTLYIADNDVRADYSAVTDGKVYSYHFIGTPQNYAIWSDQIKTAPIFYVSTVQNLMCRPWWIVDSNLFNAADDAFVSTYATPAH